MSGSKQSFKGLSKRAASLLGRPESVEVEFKQSPSSLDSADIVAFANSPNGGAILIGIRDDRGPQGEQVGRIVGCQTGDGARLQILDKAMSCVPPVPVALFVENSADVPFLRLEIASGPDKPYCTSGGTYKTREDGRVRALHPADLLKLLVDKEASLFEQRFAQATATLLDEIRATAATVNALNAEVTDEIQHIASVLGWADSKVDETASDIQVAKSIAAKALEKASDAEARLLSLLRHHNVKDPIKDDARAKMINDLVEHFKGNPNDLDRLKEGGEISLRGGRLDLFTKEELKAMIIDAARLAGGSTA